ncbi:hypothetical protein EV360DRAFT_54771, partial [Lentinula raphanica]
NISFLSSDGVPFRLDRWHLALVSTVLLPICCLTDEVVELQEDSQTLEILFNFVYPARSIPDIGALSFDALMNLFNAADKYAFNSAIEISLSHFQKFAKAHPFQILTSAARRNHATLLATVAPYSVNLSPKLLEALGFSTELCTEWVSLRLTLA